MEIMGKYKKNGCREGGISSVISYKLLSFQTFHKLLQSTISTLLLLPALFSCAINEAESERTTIMMKATGGRDMSGTLDIFTFDSEGTGYLDSYQRIESYSGPDIELRSQNGVRNIFICMNGQRGAHDWAAVNSMQSLNDFFIELKDERREALCATWDGEIMTGSGSGYTVEMRNMASEIVLNSIMCDFQGKSYEGQPITEPAVYLTNVNCRCSLTSDRDIVPSGIINAGRADPEDIALMAEPDMLYHKMEDDIIARRTEVGLSFICYPNAGSREGPGTPFTRLVIEGKIGGETFWWPVDINRNEETDKPGIHRNTRYIFDINITGKGSSDPDIILEKDALEVKMSIMPWEEIKEQKVTF